MSFFQIKLLVFLLAFPLLLAGQSSADCEPLMRLVDVEIKRDAAYVILPILAQGPDCRPMKLGKSDLTITEKVAGLGEAKELEIDRIDEKPVYEKNDLNQETVQVLFLVDAGGQGVPAAAAEMIGNFLRGSDYFRQFTNATFQLRTFADELSEPLEINPEQPEAQLSALREISPAGRSGVHTAVIGAMRDLDSTFDKHLVFLFSRGIDEPRDYWDVPRLPPRESDVLNEVGRHLRGLYFFTLSPSGGAAAGAVNGLMSKLPALTPQPEDSYAVGALPRGVKDIFITDERLVVSHEIQVKTHAPVIKGRERTYTLTDLSGPKRDTTVITKRFGSGYDQWVIGQRAGAKRWLAPVLIGFGLVAVLLFAFAFVVPLFRRRQFEQKYVAPYVPNPGRQILDPMTREPIPPGEPVVNICARVVPWQTWKDCGLQCPHYPGCTSNNLQCKGEGVGRSQKFFSLQGINRRLNWVWFGAAGGMLGFVIYALVAGIGGEAISRFASSSLSQLENAETLLRDSLLGACFGLGLTFMLAWMEERAQSRRKSWFRIVGRTVLGGLIATAAFGLGFLLLQSSLLSSPLLVALLSWIVFGVGLGVVLSLKSSIDLKRGLLGGLLAGVVGFLVHWLLGLLLGASLVPQVVSVFVTGGLLGLVLDTVVKLAENYEMEYVTPSNYRRNVPLSKWLKSDWEILIGTQPGCQVYVKWPDEDVLPEHAIMKMEDGRVFLFPQGETLINGRIINGNKRTQLASGDTIQLGRRGVTTMRFWER